MTIATKKPAPAIKLKELLAAKERLEELKQAQAVAREEELRIREYLARKLHDGVEGSKTITVEGVKCTITRNLTRTIGVDEAEKLSKEHSDLALACLRWKAEIRVGEYKKHTDILDDYIVTKAGPPSVEFR
jgi:signal transduction histidine kinase